jgi:phosphatidylglycerol:prolipoprotein diacylglycerol transferase
MHPILFHLGLAVVPSYGVLAALAVVAGLLLTQRTAPQQSLNPHLVWTASVLALFLSAIAAKAAAIGMHWQAFREQPLQLLSLTALGGSGQGYIGLAIGLVVVLVYGARHKIPHRALLDSLAAPLLLALAIESIGCLLAGSAFGTPSHAWWGIRFHTLYAMLWWGTPMGIPLVPVQILTAILDFLLALFIYWMGNWGLRTGRLAGSALLGAGTAHFLLQFWRGDVDTLAPQLPLTATQLVCLGMMAAAVYFWWDLKEWRYGAVAD